jgi:heme oxygenase
MSRPRADSLRFRLRDATQAMHLNVERHFNLEQSATSRAAYCTLLQNFWCLYEPMERELLRLDWQNCGIVMRERRKAHWLTEDLACFGVDTSTLLLCTDLPKLDCVASGLGALYVLEGSTLGGQVILRTLQSQFGISSDTGARFFTSYGAEIGTMWRSYLSVLEAVGKSEDVACQIERAALETFSVFEQVLSGQTTEESLYRAPSPEVRAGFTHAG